MCNGALPLRRNRRRFAHEPAFRSGCPISVSPSPLAWPGSGPPFWTSSGVSASLVTTWMSFRAPVSSARSSSAPRSCSTSAALNRSTARVADCRGGVPTRRASRSTDANSPSLAGLGSSEEVARAKSPRAQDVMFGDPFPGSGWRPRRSHRPPLTRKTMPIAADATIPGTPSK